MEVPYLLDPSVPDPYVPDPYVPDPYVPDPFVPVLRVLAEVGVADSDNAEARRTREAANPSNSPPPATAHGLRRANAATSSRIWSELELRK
jgi:hypothetical protein